MSIAGSISSARDARFRPQQVRVQDQAVDAAHSQIIAAAALLIRRADRTHVVGGEILDELRATWPRQRRRPAGSSRVAAQMRSGGPAAHRSFPCSGSAWRERRTHPRSTPAPAIHRSRRPKQGCGASAYRASIGRAPATRRCRAGKISSVTAEGLYSAASASAETPIDVTMPLKPFSRAVSRRKRAKREIVLDDEQHGCTRRQAVAVIADLVDRRRATSCRHRLHRCASPWPRRPRAARPRRARARLAGRQIGGHSGALSIAASTGAAIGALSRKAWRHVDLRQIQRERAAGARRAHQPQLATQQPRQLAADRQSRARCRRTSGSCCRPPAGTPRK